MSRILLGLSILFFLIPFGLFGSEDIFEAVSLNDTGSVLLYLSGGGDPNAKDEYGTTLLMLASKSGSIDSVRLLLHDKSAVDIPEARGKQAEIAIILAMPKKANINLKTMTVSLL